MVSAVARDRPRVVGIVLAAGGSSRFGSPKQLARRRGRPLLANALEALQDALDGGDIVVVLGASALRLRALVRRELPDARVVVNARWRSGLASSLHAGLRAAPSDVRAALVTLVDQPDVDSAALRRLLAAWRSRPGAPAAATYSGRAGVPAILPRRTWPALYALGGDAGARALLRGTPTITLVAMPEAELDVDTPADLSAVRTKRARERRRPSIED